MVRPSIDADSIRPSLACSMKSEYGTASFVPGRASNCLTTVRTTRPTTSQMRRFLSRLFNVLPSGAFRRIPCNSSRIGAPAPALGSLLRRAEALADQKNLPTAVAGCLRLAHVGLVEVRGKGALQ